MKGKNWLEKSFTKNNNSNKKFMTNSKAAPRASVYRYIEFKSIIIQFLVKISVQKGFGLQNKINNTWLLCINLLHINPKNSKMEVCSINRRKSLSYQNHQGFIKSIWSWRFRVFFRRKMCQHYTKENIPDIGFFSCFCFVEKIQNRVKVEKKTLTKEFIYHEIVLE